jgi:hypothetical protein
MTIVTPTYRPKRAPREEADAAGADPGHRHAGADEAT